MVTCFVSYAHDTSEHRSKVVSITDKLRSGGVDATIDAYETHPSQGWPKWMEQQLSSNDLCLLVLSPRYVGSFRQEGSSGFGARYEGAMISAKLLRNGVDYSAVAIGIVSPYEQVEIPDILFGCTRYRVDTPDGFDDFYRFATRQPLHVKPQLGSIVRLGAASPTEARGQTFADCCRKILPLFAENRRIFEHFGPNSNADSAGPVRHDLAIWYNKRPEIVGNNRTIAELVREYRTVIPENHKEIFERLLSHIEAFEMHVEDPKLDYRNHQFPRAIVGIVEASAK